MEQKTTSKRKPRAKKVEGPTIEEVIEKMRKKPRSSYLMTSRDIEGKISNRLMVSGKPMQLKEADYEKIRKAAGIEKVVRESGHSAAFDPPAIWYRHEYRFLVEDVVE